MHRKQRQRKQPLRSRVHFTVQKSTLSGIRGDVASFWLGRVLIFNPRSGAQKSRDSSVRQTGLRDNEMLL